MGILITILLFIIVAVSLWLLFKILKWTYIKKERVVATLLLLIFIALATIIYRQYFVKMTFIQSEIYPNLYLIKNPPKDINIVNKIIKEKVIQLTNNQVSKEIQSHNFSFYKYSNGDWGENGTAYFLKNKERRDGMTAELLEYYPEHLFAKFKMQPCKTNNNNFYRILDYYHETKRVKTDTLLNPCTK